MNALAPDCCAWQVVELPREDPSKALRTFAAVPNLQARAACSCSEFGH